MPPLRLAGFIALVAGALLLVAALTVPMCENSAGTARDSGYPCKLTRSGGSTEFVLSRTSDVSVPRAEVLGVALLIGGGLVVARTRR